MPSEPFDSSPVIRRILGGDLEAFREIITAHERDVQGVVAALLERREGTRELVQQTFIRVYQHLDRFDPARGDFRVWIRGIARHVVQGELRRRAREHARLGFYWEYLSAQPADAEAEAERAEALRGHVEACLGKLEGDAARVIALRYARGEAMDEVARQLGRTLDTARKLLSRARLLVRECVERHLAASP